MILLSASKVRLVVQRDDGTWSFLTWTRNRSSIHRQPEWVMKWWKWRPLFSKRINATFSSNWKFPYLSGSSQFLISSRQCDSSIFDWKNEFSISLGKNYFLCIESFRVDFWCVHRFQLLKVCNQYVTFQSHYAYNEYPRNNPSKILSPNRWILD